MKKYNRSLDYITLAMVKAREGQTTIAAKLFASAINSPDAKRAIEVLETSNRQAYAATAGTKATKATAKAKVEAEFDVGDDDDLEDLVASDDTGDDAEDDDVVEDETEIDASDEGEDEEGFDTEFASVLAGMNKQVNKKARR